MFAQALFSISLRLKISRREIENNVVQKFEGTTKNIMEFLEKAYW